MNDLDALKVERDENDQRKEPTVSEKVALAEAIAEKLKGRVGNPDMKGNSGNISLIEVGQTRDIAAAKAGLGSGKTLEAAKRVVEHGAPELIEAMDEGLVSINTAYHTSTAHTISYTNPPIKKLDSSITPLYNETRWRFEIWVCIQRQDGGFYASDSYGFSLAVFYAVKRVALLRLLLSITLSRTALTAPSSLTLPTCNPCASAATTA